MRTIFWLSVAIIAYVYVGYPALIAAWARLVRRTPKRASIEAVTLVAVHLDRSRRER